jgi:diaminopimelate decarboxylase
MDHARRFGFAPLRGDRYVVRVDAIVARALEDGLITDDEPAAIVYDLDLFRARLAALEEAFPRALNTLAVKAAPLPRLLERAAQAGFGLEVASSGEITIAERAGASGDRVVFDSPAKTRGEIAAALARGHRLNVDNFQELARVAEEIYRGGVAKSARVGLRVNPEVSGATIADTFTAGRGAKFGVPIEACRAEIVAAFERHSWLTGLHVHAGSQGVPLDAHVAAIARVCELAREIGARTIDIGGGLPAQYDRDAAPPPTFASFARALAARAPELFDGSIETITELGRAVFAPCAIAVSKVEYTRMYAGTQVAVVHFGADLFVRAAYRPDQWRHDIDVLDAHGAPKAGARSRWSIAGPLCFSGDFVARDRELPNIEPGDVVVVRDAGAYTLAMWSRYNSRLAPAVYGYAGEDGFTVLKPRETEDDVARFWGG